MKEHTSGKKGFTLIEILIAIVIFTCAMFAGIKLINSATENNAYSRNSMTAVYWVESVVEWLRYQPVCLTVDSKTGNCKTRNKDYFGESLPFTRTIPDYQIINGIHYNLTWIVSEMPDSDSNKVDVKLEWTEKSAPRSFMITFIKGRNSG
jgi:prepilin-type N-terminal cleavage/methylation domain-containing protein